MYIEQCVHKQCRHKFVVLPRAITFTSIAGYGSVWFKRLVIVHEIKQDVDTDMQN